MPAGLTCSETKRDVHETTTCCACSEYLDYGLPEAGSDDTEIRDIKWHTLNLVSGSWDMIFLCQVILLTAPEQEDVL